MKIKTFDPRQVSLIIGNTIIQGLAATDAISITTNEEQYKLVRDLSGTAPMRIKTNNYTATMTVKLTQESPSNDFLSGLLALDRSGNLGLVPFLLKDNLGSTLYTAPSIFITKMPDVSFSSEETIREWEFSIGELVPFLGGLK